MNKITNEEIMSYLQEQTNELVKEYGNNIMGTFVIGNANYGFAESIDEVFIIAIYVPNFEDLCLGNTFHEYDKNSRVVIDDIRNCYNAEMDIWKDYLELLFSDYYIIMEPYAEIFKKMFIDKRELMSKARPKERIKCAAARAIECHKEKPFEAYRLLLAANEYEKGKDTNFCFHLDANPAYNKFLWDIKQNNQISDEELFLINCEGIMDRASVEPNTAATQAIKDAVISIIESSLHINSVSDTFCSSITDMERQALKAIIKEIGSEGNITISKMVDKTKLSRPVYTNLLNKMKTHNVATIANQGVKGTHIKITDRRLLKA